MKTSLSRRVKKALGRFRSDSAGKRFVNLYRSAQKLKPIVRVGLGGLGLALGVAGLLLGLVPGVPGIVLGIAGFALVAAQFKSVAAGADHAEVGVREFWADLRSHFRFMMNSRSRRVRHNPGKRKTGTRRAPKIRHATVG